VGSHVRLNSQNFTEYRYTGKHRFAVLMPAEMFAKAFV